MNRALVTGADGFIGSHLVERLLHEQVEVTALCLYNSNGSIGWLEEIPGVRDRVDIQLGDVRDSEFVDRVVREHSTVFHLAALIAIPYSYLAPRSFVETNVIGTLNVLEAIRRNPGIRMINTSTSEVYGTPKSTPISEDHAIQPQSPYAASKASADDLCRAYAASFDVDVLTLRPFNTYGPRQSLRAVIPTILLQMLSGASEIRLGSLHPRRDFTFVEDTVDGFIRIARADVNRGTTIQLGTGTSVSIGEVVELCRDITGSSAVVTVDDERIRPATSEVQVLLSDPTRAGEVLGWSPRTDLRSGLEHLASWLDGRDTADAHRYHR
jgi:UDP-glucose 4-epimerase